MFGSIRDCRRIKTFSYRLTGFQSWITILYGLIDCIFIGRWHMDYSSLDELLKNISLGEYHEYEQAHLMRRILEAS